MSKVYGGLGVFIWQEEEEKSKGEEDEKGKWQKEEPSHQASFLSSALISGLNRLSTLLLRASIH